MNPTEKWKTDGVSTPKERRMSSQLEYKRKWEQEYDFKKWFIRDPNNEFGVTCTLCNSFIASGKSSAKVHMMTKGHQERIAKIRKINTSMDNPPKKTRTIDRKSVSPSNGTTTKDSTMVQKAELKLSAFFLEHAIAFDAAEHLGPLLKDCFPDSEICQGVTFSKEKVQNTITKVIDPNMTSKLADKLSKCKFSILVDEITDTSSKTRTFCVIVRYFDSGNGRIQSSFWKLHQAPCQAGTPTSLYKDIKDSFLKHDIPVKNIVGFGADGGNSVMEALASRFKAECPGIIIVKCISHSMHLCASEACKIIPNKCEILARAGYNFLEFFTKRSAQLPEFQTFLDLTPQKMLHPSQARWLSLAAVVNCILEQWPALTRFITKIPQLEQAIAGGPMVLALIQNDFIKLYYYFLQWVLRKFNNLNACFQSSKMITTELNAKIEELYKDILLCFMERKYVMETKLQDIDPKASDKLLNHAQMFLGVVVRKQISDNPKIRDNPVELQQFHRGCLNFFQIGVTQIRKRWDFGNPLMAAITALNPKVARSSKEPSILPLLKILSRISVEYDINLKQLLEDQWRKLPLVDFPKDILEENEPDIFWSKILNWKNINDEKEFSVLARFALDALIIIPHANADCERIFRSINLTKTRMRYKLGSDCETTCQMTILSDNIKRNKNGCVGFQPSTEMINSMTSSTLHREPDVTATTSKV